MKNLATGIFNKATGSAFSTSIGGRLYDGRVPQNPTAPYVVYYIITSVSDRTFSEDMTDCVVQFSIFSEASAQTEILDIGTKLIAVYDKAILTATGWKQIFMELASGEGVVTDYPADTLAGTGAYFQCDVNFDILLSRS